MPNIDAKKIDQNTIEFWRFNTENCDTSSVQIQRENLLSLLDIASKSLATPSLAGEAVEGLAYTGAISLASIDEGAPRPETWKERAENQQAVFLLAKRRAEAAETRAEELEKALDREIAHADELRQSATSATMREAWDVAYTSLRRARTALEAPNA